MRLIRFTEKGNANVLKVGSTQVLFSYERPVAVRAGGVLLVLDEFISVTTRKHVEQFTRSAGECKVRRVNAAEIERAIVAA